MLKTRVTIFVVCILALLSSCDRSHDPYETPWESVNANDSISFVILGDWGRGGNSIQQAVADQIDITGQKHHIDFIITTGDNFYENGVRSTSDLLWQVSYENVYNKTGHQVPWYPVLGNHDYRLNPNAQILYARKSNRWKMPARYYAIAKSVGDFSAFFVFTDTSPFVHEYYNDGWPDLHEQDTAAQLQWIRWSLSSSKDKWKFVVGHHPVYSVGRHGNTTELRERFRPVFSESRADFYLAGHDHSLQFLKIPGDRTGYIISGAGSQTTSVSPRPGTWFAAAKPGFVIITLYDNTANIYYYDHRGTLLYRAQVRK